MRSHALLLAAGAGRRMGTPKALVTGADGQPWVVRVIRVLDEGGCDAVSVVIGAGAHEVEPLVVAAGARPVLATDLALGMGSSLVVGVDSVTADDPQADVIVLMLVDLPDVTAAVVARLLDHARRVGTGAVARAAYGGRPGHPVVLGRDHWGSLAAGLAGDRGARDWLAGRTVDVVECGDLAGGEDVDDPLRLAAVLSGKDEDGSR